MPLVIGLAQLPLRPLVTLLSRPQWQGTENFPASGAVIACGNHLSAFDPRYGGHLLQASGIAPRFLAKESLFRVCAGARRPAALGPADPGAARHEPLRDALDAARGGAGPGRAADGLPRGHLHPRSGASGRQARLGAARLALSTGAPLLPIATWGGRGLWPVGSPLPRPGRGRRVRMRVGEAFTAAAGEGETEHEAAPARHRGADGAHAGPPRRSAGLTPPDHLHDPRTDAFTVPDRPHRSRLPRPDEPRR